MFRASPESPERAITATADAARESVFEADTPAEALAQVSAALGRDAEVLGIDTVLRGGVGGFFAREVVQVRARPRSLASSDGPAAAADTRSASAQAATGDEDAIARVLAQLTREADGDERTFAEALRSELARHEHPPALPPAAAGVPAKPAAGTPPAAASPPAAGRLDQDPDEQPVAGAPQWSAENLVRLGLPGALVRTVAAQQPRDDLGWLHALGRSLATLCRPLPAGEQLVVGPCAALLANALDLPVIPPGQRLPARGSVIVEAEVSAEERARVAGARGNRWLHVVVGGEGWRELLFDEPLALSWATPEALPPAVGLCAELGMVLGSGPGPRGEVARANPVDLAMVVRTLLPRWDVS